MTEEQLYKLQQYKDDADIFILNMKDGKIYIRKEGNNFCISRVENIYKLW